MRLGISTSLEGLSPKEWGSKLSSLGCKSVVFPVDYTADDKLIDEYVTVAKENDLKIAEVGIWRNAISEDPAEAEKNMEYSIGRLFLGRIFGKNCGDFRAVH